MRNAGPAICKDHASIYHSVGLDIITLTILIPVYNSPARTKAIAPTNSCFQEIIKTTSRIIDGMLCINKPSIVPQNPKLSSKTSKENIARNRIKTIDSILGVQYSHRLIFFSFFSFFTFFLFIFISLRLQDQLSTMQC